MGTAWKFGTGLGALAVTAWIAYFSTSKIYALLIIAIALSLTSLLGFLISLAILINKRLKPLDIIDEIHCTYWTKEKEVGVIVWICDYSGSREFQTSCIVTFNNQSVSINPVRLDGPFFGNTSCNGGVKRMIEFNKKDIEILEPDECLITLTIKPKGLWATKRIEKGVDTQIVIHG